MNSVDFFDKHLDPPDGPTHWECDCCHERFDGGDLTKVDDYWYCNECFVPRAETEVEDDENN